MGRHDVRRFSAVGDDAVDTVGLVGYAGAAGLATTCATVNASAALMPQLRECRRHGASLP